MLVYRNPQETYKLTNDQVFLTNLWMTDIESVQSLKTHEWQFLNCHFRQSGISYFSCFLNWHIEDAFIPSWRINSPMSHLLILFRLTQAGPSWEDRWGVSFLCQSRSSSGDSTASGPPPVSDPPVKLSNEFSSVRDLEILAAHKIQTA